MAFSSSQLNNALNRRVHSTSKCAPEHRDNNVRLTTDRRRLPEIVLERFSRAFVYEPHAYRVDEWKSQKNPRAADGREKTRSNFRAAVTSRVHFIFSDCRRQRAFSS